MVKLTIKAVAMAANRAMVWLAAARNGQAEKRDEEPACEFRVHIAAIGLRCWAA
jgi:hypothetical protein